MAIPLKSPEEVERMRISCQAAALLLDDVMDLIQPGLTTREVDEFAAERIAEYGGTSPFHGYRGFPGNICISINEEVVHGIAGPRRIREGDVVKLDVGIVIDGWVGDTAATVALDPIDSRVAELIRATRQALDQGVREAVAGRRVGDISFAIERHILSAGFSIVRDFVGHGVGRELHEEPHVPNHGRQGQGPVLEPGMTLAIEPMVSMGRPDVRILADQWTVVTCDEQPSAHFEHTVLITPNEPEILTIPCRTTTAFR